MESGYRVLTKVLTTKHGGSGKGAPSPVAYYRAWLLLTQGICIYFYLGLL